MASSVTVDFNANLARFSSSIDKATNDLNKFQSNAQRVSSNIGTAFAALGGGLAVAGLAAWAKGVINAADELGKLSQKIGISVEDLAGFKHAADLSDISLDQFATGVKQLSRYMGEYGDKLKAAGITATDAKGALIQLADAFAKMPDGTQKTAIAMEILGKAGADMIPLLNGGGDALRDMMDEGRRFNPITTEMAKRAEIFNDNLTRLKASAGGVGVAIAEDLLPPLIDLSGRLQQAFAPGLVDGFTSRWGAAFKGLAAGMNETLAASEEFLAKVTFGDVSQNHLRQAIAFRESAKRIYAEIAALSPAAAAASGPASGPTTLEDLLGPEKKGGKGSKGKKDKPFDPEGDALFALDEAIRKKQRAYFDEQDAEAEKSVKRLNDLLAATPSGQLAKAREEMQFLADALEHGAINEEQFTEAVGVHYGKAVDALDEMGEFTKEAARNMQDAMADGFFDLMQGKFDNLGSQFKAVIDRMVANAVAADLSNRLFGDFGKTGQLGGFGGSALSAAGSALTDYFIPQFSFASGIDYVPRDMTARIHEGERVVPKEQNRTGGFGGNITININGSASAPDVRRAAGQGAREALAVFAGAQRYG